MIEKTDPVTENTFPSNMKHKYRKPLQDGKKKTIDHFVIKLFFSVIDY